MRRLARYLWAAPVTAPGLALAASARWTGGSVRRAEGVVEASGGWPGSFLGCAIPGFPIAAITLGHVVLAASEEEMGRCRAHERSHVAQYERWGVLFPLLYAAASLTALASGRNAYRDNVFEREADRAADAAAA